MPAHDDGDRIKPWVENPGYWQYCRRPVLLLGGSVEDNLFQVEGLEAHLDLLKSVGGNYVRCTMSSRDKGNVWPFAKDEATGLYDLERPGRQYWERLARFLKLAFERDIMVQIELWDRFDFAREPWRDNPFNLRLNSNYTAGESGLVERIDSHPGKRTNAFFRTVPKLENNELVLRCQRAYVDKLLSISLEYPNVLYCMDNETNESPEWGAYWSQYIRAAAGAAGVGVETTEMWDAWDLSHPHHANTLDHPESYSFLDISQNNHQKGQAHWDNAFKMHQRIKDSGCVRPMNCVKIYGADGSRFGDSRDGQERFWRNLFVGTAAARFHRPPSGLGLGEIARAHLKSARQLTERMNVFECEPHNELLAERSDNEAYCLANPGVEYAVFFTDGGSVLLDASTAAGKPLSVHWLDIMKSEWRAVCETVEPGSARSCGSLRLATPAGTGSWAALVSSAG